MKKIIMPLIIIFTMLLAGCNDSNITVTDQAQKLTVQTLKQDNTVSDAAVDVKDNTICIAIKVNTNVSKQKATDIIDTAIRQLASHSGGNTPTKDYLGELWENYDAKVLVYSDSNAKIATGIKAAGQHNHVIIE